MSLPLTRRIARAALLIAAGAAPVVGAAGSANAAELPATPDLGGVTALDGAGLGNTVDGAAQNATGLAGETGSKAVKKGVPTAGKVVGSGAKTTTPVAQKAAGDLAGNAGDVVGDAAGTATKDGLPTDAVAKGGLPTDAVTKGGLPTDQLPVKSPLG
ncbi:ATP-binding protein [Streptomyces durmitorensis]|uniref:ATP-binding protein n=1 Tax=Streptomyces durmitorensis TaxID=319947 RepID=A0ABY4PU70_9ACTN|nr:ATP-binding protein [Streptomyces durmitorensis]UQT56473.1 ATP-binding protein [Streptomyces durmitorensis]